MAIFYHGIVALLVIFFCLVNLSHQQAGECRTFPSCCSLNSSTSCGTETPCPGGRLTCDPTGACCCIKFDSKYTHLTTGAAKPPLVPGKVRVYHTRCCPTTHGVMLVAKAKNISMDVVYINLDNRPEWLENELGGVESHPVPIIELENGTLIRSMILNSEFLDNTFPVQGELCPKDLSKKINDRVLIDEFDTVMAQLFRDIVFGIGFKSPEKVPALIKEFEFGVMRLGEELDRRGTKFLVEMRNLEWWTS